MRALDLADTGNIVTRLTHALDAETVRQRFAASLARIQALAPAAEITVDSASEIVFRLFGLEFARACLTPVSGSFRNAESILFGIGSAEYVLDESTEALFGELVQGILEQRHAGGSATNLFFRLAPERWLESLITRDVRVIDERLDGRYVYSQVPAFAASDRAMLDVLTCTLDGRLAILELKANEDIHLPLQGLDYWARVRWHQQHGEFTRNGYFAGRELSSAPPLLFLVAPALRVHPASDVLLRYLSPRIEWTLVQVDEHWRDGGAGGEQETSTTLKRFCCRITAGGRIEQLCRPHARRPDTSRNSARTPLVNAPGLYQVLRLLVVPNDAHKSWGFSPRKTASSGAKAQVLC